MKKRWMIVGMLSAGLTLTAAPGTAFAEKGVSGAGVVGTDSSEDVTVKDDTERAGFAEAFAVESRMADDNTKESGIVVAEDVVEGFGIVRDENAQDTVFPGELEIDGTIGRNFIKQEFIECIGKDRSKVELRLGEGGESEKTEDYAAEKYDFHVNYVLSDNEDVRVDYKDNIAVRIFGTNTELLNFEKDEYTLSEIDEILQVVHVTLEGNAHFWHLQDEPDVTLELVNGYASLYVD